MISIGLFKIDIVIISKFLRFSYLCLDYVKMYPHAKFDEI